MSTKKGQELGPTIASLETALRALEDKAKADSENPRKKLESIRVILQAINELVEWIRLSGAYLEFDLEATRRENGYLRKMLEEQNGGQ